MIRRSILALCALALFSNTVAGVAAENGSGKTSAKEVKRDVGDAAESIKNYSVEKRDEAVQKAKAALDALDVRIAALEANIDANWDKMNKAARERARASLNALHKQRIAAAEWYGSLKNSSAAAWEQMKKGFSTAYEATRDAWQKAEHEFGEKNRKK